MGLKRRRQSSTKGQIALSAPTMRSFPEEAFEPVLSFLSSNADRNSVSLVCKSWYDIERQCRRHVLIRNCYSVSPQTLIRRFTDVRSVTIKGKHNLARTKLAPNEFRAHAHPWIAALVTAYPAMKEIRLKRMVVTDKSLELVGTQLQNLRVWVLNDCQGVYSGGLSSIAANCMFDSDIH